MTLRFGDRMPMKKICPACHEAYVERARRWIRKRWIWVYAHAYKPYCHGEECPPPGQGKE